MADEPVGEVKALVVYELTQFADTQGREVTRLTPMIDGLCGKHDGPGVRFRGKVEKIEGRVRASFTFEIAAGTIGDALEKFDARCDEEWEKILCEQRKKALAAGTPKIDDFRRGRIRRIGGNGG